MLTSNRNSASQTAGRMHGKHTVSSAELPSPVQRDKGMQIKLDNLNLLALSKRKNLPSVGKEHLQRKRTPSFTVNFYLMRSPCPDVFFLKVANPANLQTFGLYASLTQYQPPGEKAKQRYRQTQTAVKTEMQAK